MWHDLCGRIEQKENISIMRDMIFRFLKLVVIVIMIPVFTACKKNDPTPSSTSPLAISNAAAWVGPGWAVIKGQVNGRSQLTHVTFQYDTTTTYTNIVTPVIDTTSGSTLISFHYTLNNLKPSRRYHYRINATNASGTAFGADVSFITSDSSIVTIGFNPDITYDSIYDIEGNKYRTVQIGTQTWTAENLRSTKYNDGTDIPFVPDVNEWATLTSPGYAWYNSDSIGYGALYNWYVVNTGKLCPQGWHVPSDEEWTVLSDYLGGSDVAGGKLKEAGTTHWLDPNFEGTNETGFTALPSGYRSYGGSYNSTKSYGFWWTSTEWSSLGAWYRDVYYGYSTIDRSNSHKRSGATVRCVKD
jgi:uncharacterized protein (TIGR02145 family)